MIDHKHPCNGQPCTCGAFADAMSRKSMRALAAKYPGPVVQANLLADRLGIADTGREGHAKSCNVVHTPGISACRRRALREES